MQKQLLIGGVGLVRGRVRDAGPVMVEICDELEPHLNEIGFTDSAPFRTVSLILRFGEKEDLSPEYSRIDRRHQELPVAVELPMEVLRKAKRDELKQLFRAATMATLIDVGRKYDLPVTDLEKRVTATSLSETRQTDRRNHEAQP